MLGKISYLFLAIFSFVFAGLSQAYAQEDQDTLPVGNFSLPNSQQPGPLISFGQNILDKNQKQFFVFADDYAGANSFDIDIIPGFLYGIRDDLSLFLNLPMANYKYGSAKSTGLEDALIQLEYAFYTRSTKTFQDQATIVLNVSAPTGSIHKNPPTGSGSTSFFAGATFSRMYPYWYIFTSSGAQLTTAKQGTKFGDSYLYQAGFANTILVKHGWLWAWMLEFDGTYTQKDRLFGSIDPDSGGNLIYLTPSLWASTKTFIFQLGAGYPVVQKHFGNQQREHYVLVANLGWTI